MAVVERSPSATTVQVGDEPADEHELVHPTNSQPGEGMAVSVTEAPLSTPARQASLHTDPSTSAETEPDPLVSTANAKAAGTKNALVDRSASATSTQVGLRPASTQELVHPANFQPGSGTAVSETDWPRDTVATHWAPQSSPPTLEVTTPCP